MQTNLVKELTAAHINSLNSSVHALETQVTILKTLLNGGETTGADETDNDSDDTDFAPPAKKTKKKAAGTKSFEDDDAASDDAPAESDDDDADFSPPAKKGKKAAKSFDDEEEEESEETTPPKKAAKAKKITMDDVNDACMERAGRTNRAEVLSVLKTKFKVKTVTALKPEQYEEVVAAMKGKK